MEEIKWFVVFVDETEEENYVLATDEELDYLLLNDKVIRIVRCQEG